LSDPAAGRGTGRRPEEVDARHTTAVCPGRRSFAGSAVRTRQPQSVLRLAGVAEYQGRFHLADGGENEPRGTAESLRGIRQGKRRSARGPIRVHVGVSPEIVRFCDLIPRRTSIQIVL
jgi:hypothetical protein